METNLNQFVAIVGMLVGILVTPLFFILFDLWAGCRKAKQRNEPILSDKLQRTIAKIARYYNALLAFVVIDIMQISSLWYLQTYCGWNPPLFPFFTLMAAFGVAAIEVKSIYEKAEDKAKRDMRQVTYLAAEIAKSVNDPKDLARLIADYLRNDSNGSNIK